VKILTSCLLVALTATGIASSSGKQQVRASEERPEVRLTLSVPRNSFKLGEPIPVRLEIANEGQSDFLVGRALRLGVYTDPSYIWIGVTDTAGKASPVTGISLYSITETDAGWWIALAPKHFYGTEFNLDRGTHEFLKIPGRYRLEATYVSSGGATAAIPSENIESRKVWHGKIASNTVSVEIGSQ
jgi:hypothetical protein